MCFITFREHLSFKKKRQNKAKQKYSSGELSIREKSKICFKIFLWVGRMELGQAGPPLSQRLTWSLVSLCGF